MCVCVCTRTCARFSLEHFSSIQEGINFVAKIIQISSYNIYMCVCVCVCVCVRARASLEHSSYVKLSLYFLTEHHPMKAYWGVEV
jgi:hypothetical protein